MTAVTQWFWERPQKVGVYETGEGYGDERAFAYFDGAESVSMMPFSAHTKIAIYIRICPPCQGGADSQRSRNDPPPIRRHSTLPRHELRLYRWEESFKGMHCRAYGYVGAGVLWEVDQCCR
jgi:hypothetical protein